MSAPDFPAAVDLLAHALEDAAILGPVFPLEPGGKRPLGQLVPHGLKQATREPDLIRSWWGSAPRANVGVRTGQTFDVLDLDSADAKERLHQLARQHGADLSAVPLIQTGKGWHLLFRPSGMGNRAGLLPGIDFRGAGGYIVGPGSVHPNGARYEWRARPNGAGLPELPEFLRQLLEKRPAPKAQSAPTDGDRPGERYLETAMRDELAAIRSAPKGQRNHTLNQAAFALGQLVGAGWLARGLVDAELRAAGLAAGLEEREVDATIRSGVEAGLRDPRPSPPAADRGGEIRHGAPAVAAAGGQGLAAEGLRFISARELAEETPERPEWVHEGTLAAGAITELDGKAKLAGKTTAVMHLVRAITRGEPFLDRPTRKGTVVYLWEERKGTIRQALGRAGLEDCGDLFILPYHLTKGTEWPEVGRQALAFAKSVDALLLVVDTLPSFAGLRDERENAAGAALEAMEPLIDVAAAGLAVLIVRHDRRAGGEVGESGRGSTAFTGAVDIVLHLTRLGGEGHENMRQLEGVGRFDEIPANLIIELGEDGYRVVGSEQDLKAAEARDLLLAILPSTEAEAIGLPSLWKEGGALHAVDISPSWIRKAAEQLLAAGQVCRIEINKRSHRWYVCSARGGTAHVSAERTEAAEGRCVQSGPPSRSEGPTEHTSSGADGRLPLPEAIP